MRSKLTSPPGQCQGWMTFVADIHVLGYGFYKMFECNNCGRHAYEPIEDE